VASRSGCSGTTCRAAEAAAAAAACAPELSGYGGRGEQAALSGVALRGLVDLFLSATWRLWRELPAGTSPTAVRAPPGRAAAADDAVAAARRASSARC